MSLGADIAAALPELRAHAESMMQDTYTVLRRTGETVTDPDTLEETAEYVAVLTDVMGKFRTVDADNRDAQTPGMKVAETGLAWHTSVNTFGVLTDDEVLCTAVGPLGDPESVGRRVRVTGPFVKSFATARRFRVEELS